jgi:hypothetical protein
LEVNLQLHFRFFKNQEHIFEKQHLDSVRVAIEQGRYDPPSPGEALNQAIAALQPAGSESARFASSPPPTSVSGPSSMVNSQLQILQMAARLPPPPEGAVPVDPAAGDESLQREKMEKALLQLYGMGHAPFPGGVAAGNPFLHPAMFSTSGKFRKKYHGKTNYLSIHSYMYQFQRFYYVSSSSARLHT